MDEAPILICYDGSEAAQRAIEVAAALLGPRRAVVLDVGPLLTPVESVAAVSAVPAAAFEEANSAEALMTAQEGAERARSVGFDAVARGFVAGPTWDAVVDVGDEIDDAVIVTGSRGLTGGRELIEGSFSHNLARHAGRPVLIVPPERHKH
jgi:nucleotide-binding universal stress UspA family protein